VLVIAKDCLKAQIHLPTQSSIVNERKIWKLRMVESSSAGASSLRENAGKRFLETPFTSMSHTLLVNLVSPFLQKPEWPI
jgi:hypothetical protein